MMPNARSLISLLNITSVCHFARRSCCRAFREEREAVVDSLYTAALPLSFVFLSFAPPAESRISVPSYRNWQEGSFHDLFIVDLFGFKLSRRTLSLFFSLGSTKPFANVLDFGMVYFSKGWTFSRLDWLADCFTPGTTCGCEHGFYHALPGNLGALHHSYTRSIVTFA